MRLVRRRMGAAALSVVTALVLLFSLSGPFAHADGRLVFGKPPLFSYVPPTGWKLIEYPGLKYKPAVGPPVGGFPPSIIVTAEKFSQPLSAFVNNSMANMKKNFPTFKQTDRREFAVGDKSGCVRLASERKQGKRELRQVFYFINTGAVKFIVTCTRSAKEGEHLDKDFDEAMKTFRAGK